MDKEIYAYFAGILDGEGSIQLDPYKDRWRPRVAVASTDYELVEWLKETFGGVITTKKVYQDHHRPSFTWSVCNQAAIDLLGNSLEYLRIKRKLHRARILVEEWKGVTPRNGKYTDELTNAKEEVVNRFFQAPV